MHFSIRYIQVLRYVLQLSQESWIENRSVVPIAGIWFLSSQDMVKGQGLKAPTYLGGDERGPKGPLFHGGAEGVLFHGLQR
jgi:hypothetical protein